MLEVRNVGYQIGRKTLLREISFDARAGEFIAIIGANGAGKSTFLKTLSNENQPSQGTIKFNNKFLRSYSSKELSKSRAVLTQQNNLSFNFNVSDLVMMGRYPHFQGRPTAQDHEVVEYAIEKTGIGHLVNRIYMTLSGGEQQRVHLAKIMCQLLEHDEVVNDRKAISKPKYLLLDEPTSSLDLYYQYQLLELTAGLTKRGFCVVAILHDLNMAIQYADKVLLLKDGAALGFGNPLEVLSPVNILEAFNISMDLVHPVGAECPFLIHCKEPISKPSVSWKQHLSV
jgi:iron complex transport system ATP-binding protein